MAKVWVWLKANWKTLVVGIITLGLGLIVGRVFKKAPVVISSALTDAEKERQAAAEASRRKDADAAATRAAEVKKIEEEHTAVIAKLNEEQKAQVAKLEDDPAALNDYLLEIGKSMRQP